jgi:parallel beta-helix repeat protein
MDSLRLGGTGALAATAAIVILGVTVFLSIGIGSAESSHVSCGATITADTTLDSDLVGCPNNGIVIGADGITLDLNGHAIAGDGERFENCARGEVCDAGVLSEGRDGVTVRDGSVSRFAFGVFVGKARDHRVLHVSSSRNALFGFILFDATRSLVRDSSGSDNLAPDGDGMGVFASDHIRIIGNSFQDNPLGLHVEGSTRNLIRGNAFAGNDGGIMMEADRNEVKRNRSARDGGGILVLGNRNLIARNRYSHNGGGIAVEEGSRNLVTRNVVVRPRRIGILLGRDEPEQIGGSKNVVRRNVVRESGADAFLVASKDNASRLKRNVAVGSKDDGFDINSGSTKLTSNRAVRNGDLGIEAVRGVIDGGGNRARGNGDPRQCRNVACG